MSEIMNMLRPQGMPGGEPQPGGGPQPGNTPQPAPAQPQGGGGKPGSQMGIKDAIEKLKAAGLDEKIIMEIIMAAVAQAAEQGLMEEMTPEQVQQLVQSVPGGTQEAPQGQSMGPIQSQGV